jgi:triosephosphate isomerase
VAKPKRRVLIAGNWKSNLTHLEAVALVQKVAFMLRDSDIEAVEAVVLPPFTALRSVQTVVEGERFGVGFGAQDLSEHPGGAHTGDVSGGMLAALDCSYVVVGHSERRAEAGDTDSRVAAKVRAAYAADIVPILCVGEGIEQRRAGDHVGYATGQLRAAIDGLPAEQAGRLVLAYEPVWAIGTGEVATPDDAQEVCAALRATLAGSYDDTLAAGVRVLYGGSVKPDNAPELMEQPDIDGALVGGASLSADDFVRIVRYRDEIRVR